jgi:PqqD family protein of HPr-rel-A system
MGEKPLLRLESPDRFAWRHWDGEFVFFDELSGETRLLHGWAGAVLELIAERQPIDIERIGTELATTANLPLDDDLRDRIREAVDTLRNFVLIGDAAE